jgi:hypothetical protein
LRGIFRAIISQPRNFRCFSLSAANLRNALQIV